MKFFITTPIYYVNGAPSIGHAYTTIAADVLARYHRLLGKEVFFLTGTDENSQKNVEAAQKAGRGEDVQGYLDDMAATWQRTFGTLGFTHTRFIRTTEKDHHRAVEAFWKRVEASGDIYLGTYEGLYCKGCEAFVLESDLTEGRCPIHKTEPERIKEQNYFFRLTKYRDALLAHIEAHPEFVQPEARRNEVVSYIKNFMTDVSISRSTMKWGIPVPGDASQRIYVWFDALINYISGVGFGTDEATFAKWWPADVQLVGKDIIKFHCALWPAMLLSAGLPLPRTVFAHGFFTIDGQKMSKSLGNVIDPLEVVAEYGNDTLRYFVLREIRFGEDGDFSRARIAERYANDLGNEFGNLVNRVLSMTLRYFNGVIPPASEGGLGDLWPKYHAAMQELRFHDALDVIWSAIREGNQFVEKQKPWALAKEGKTEELGRTLYLLLETLVHIARMAWPFLPASAQKMWKSLHVDELMVAQADAERFGRLKAGDRVELGEMLFPRKESLSDKVIE